MMEINDLDDLYLVMGVTLQVIMDREGLECRYVAHAIAHSSELYSPKVVLEALTNIRAGRGPRSSNTSSDQRKTAHLYSLVIESCGILETDLLIERARELVPEFRYPPRLYESQRRT